MNRIDIINGLIVRHHYTKYLEIGVEQGLCFNGVSAPYKAGVDPSGAPANYRMTSDEFFRQLEMSEKPGSPIEYDIIFVDGLHLEEQAVRDIDNALRHLATGGVIVVHDCNPPTLRHAGTRPAIHRKDGRPVWCGTVWRAFIRLNYEETIERCCVDCDWGVGLAWKLLDRPPIQRGRLYDPGNLQDRTTEALADWKVFDKHRESLLGLITPEAFERRLAACES